MLVAEGVMGRPGVPHVAYLQYRQLSQTLLNQLLLLSVILDFLVRSECISCSPSGILAEVIVCELGGLSVQLSI